MRNAMSGMQMHISLRTVWCKLGYWVVMCSTRGHVRGRVWLKSEVSRAPEARARKIWRLWVDILQNVWQIWPKCIASLHFSFTSKFIFEGPFSLLHLNFTLKFIFPKTLCFTSLWNFFSKIGLLPCFTSRFTSAPLPLIDVAQNM